MGKHDVYLVKTVRSAGRARRLQRRGWELVGQSGGALLTATEYTLRLPNPRHRKD